MLVAPPHWDSGSESLAQIGRGPSLLMLDYDGTLAPFREDRMQALPWPGVTDRLDRLRALPSVHLTLVTGRSAHDLAALVPVKRPIEIWGSHGREHLTAEGVYSSAMLPPVQQAAIEQLERALQQAGFQSRAERKPASIAVHWRGLSAEEVGKIEQIAFDVHRKAGERAGLHLLAFDGGLEMRSDSITKGHAALHMLTQYPTAAAAYLGDDTTDEDAFSVLRGRALTLLVRDQPRPSQAAYWLRPPEELLGFLDAWIRAAERTAG